MGGEYFYVRGILLLRWGVGSGSGPGSPTSRTLPVGIYGSVLREYMGGTELEMLVLGRVCVCMCVRSVSCLVNSRVKVG